ncbi:GntR family transcriptional regulator [Streptomyces sp. DG2A-72]|uniref:GntR family transcriptional regulator n=1 Tax=Streptomyces sp. DG2A-72 TaxID=3051386 RepID=UPI00265B74AE|nr:GntR family transcriptional regulator [Streptomyces sp. DG2A-72]MDO0936563.1 GntR family transcriptional regulator [Streptomyces sp. DG2A-72]
MRGGETRSEFVERVMRRRLTDGTYQPGTLLPRQKTLAMEFHMPVHIFRQAIEPLYLEGHLIHSVKPRGTLVTHDVI